MEQDITLPFITVNKHKVSKSCFGWGGGGGEGQFSHVLFALQFWDAMSPSY